LIGNDVCELIAWIGSRSLARNLCIELLTFDVVERVDRETLVQKKGLDGRSGTQRFGLTSRSGRRGSSAIWVSIEPPD